MADQNSTHNAISAYFIGPKAENLDNFRGNVKIILDELEHARKRYAANNEDPVRLCSPRLAIQCS